MPKPVGRPRSPHLRADWKLSIRASLAAEVDLLLEDTLSHKPIYGSRKVLVERLLEHWLATVNGAAEVPPLPLIEEVRQGDSNA